MTTSHPPSHPAAVRPQGKADENLWRWVCAGSSASLVGLGLARFAYTPLIPALISAGWFAPADAAYLGAANLAGYLAGALLARSLASRFGAVPLLRFAMVAVTLSCLACAVPLSLAWFFVWRLTSGVAGALIMVLAASTILPHIRAGRRGLVGGAVFAGVGLGIAASGTLVPLLLRSGLAACWVGLATLSALLTALNWTNWPHGQTHTKVADRPNSKSRFGRRTRALVVEYGLIAFALVPHMVFLVDFVARTLGLGLDTGAGYWVLYGLGAVVGPLLAGHLADRAGFAAALRLAFLIIALSVVVLALNVSMPVLVVSSIIMGGLTTGIVPLVLGRVHELVPHDQGLQQGVWARATTGFALGQAAGAYGLSALLAHTVISSPALFVFGGAAAACALLLDLATALAGRSSNADG